MLTIHLSLHAPDTVGRSFLPFAVNFNLYFRPVCHIIILYEYALLLKGGFHLDKRPIGVFDSGLGGLTAVRELRRLLPGEDIVYFGDTGRVPYGSRSKETIIKYARQDVAFLNTFDLKAIVIACGTVSATALEVLRSENTIPVLGVVDPTAKVAANHSKNGKIGLIGTETTIRSGAYERALATLRPEAQVFPKACPLFVPLVENGRFQVGDAVAELVVEEYLSPLAQAGVDTVIMGCTHYPLLRSVIEAYMGPAVRCIDSGGATARRVADLLSDMDALNGQTGGGKCRYFVSDSTDGFAKPASLFLGEDVTEDVTQIDITAY